MKKGEKEYKRNQTINVIYYSLTYLVWIIDKLDYDYMTQWRNDICGWIVEMEKRYNWLAHDIRSIKASHKKG